MIRFQSFHFSLSSTNILVHSPGDQSV